MTKTYSLRNLNPLKNKNLDIEWLSDLNPQQKEAVLHLSGPSLVIAGAGTGKTKTLVYRVAYLIESGILPQKILLLTFTKRAAENMILRAAAVSQSAQNVQGGTFHSFSNQIIREFGHLLGYGKNFTILDSEDAQDRIDFVRTKVMDSFPKTRFPKKSTLQDIFSSHRNIGIPISQLIEESYPQFSNLLAPIVTIYENYQSHKKQQVMADYDDLLFICRDLIKNFPQILTTLKLRFDHILIDEYQDTNPIQAEIAELISGKDGNLMVVGDDAQSIYKFRGADYKNILHFPDRFPNAKIYKLEQNYRSTQQILEVANSVIRQATEKFEKNLFTERKTGDLPALISAADEHFQNQFIISKILDLREQNIPLNEIVVLFRNSRNSYSLELELASMNIPFEKRGGNKFTESAHIKDLIAYLKVIENQKDLVSWNRVLQLLDGIGPKNADEIIRKLIETENQPGTAVGVVSDRYKTQVTLLLKIISGMQNDQESIGSKIESLIKFYQPLFQKKYSEDFPKREKDLEAFTQISAQFSSISDFLSHLALEPIDFTALKTDSTQKEEAPLILSTIHSAKGLEWHSVFIMDLLEGILPSNYSINDNESMDEELRLFYVAVTRAKENLYLCYPAVQYSRSFHDYFTNPSRFLTQIPEGLTEKWILDSNPQHQIEPPKKKLTDL